MTTVLYGKKILVTGGTTREAIDGVRHYASHAKAGCLGHRAAALLAQAGADVFLVSARNAYPVAAGITAFNKSLSAEDLFRTAQGIAKTEKIDICLDLANIPNLRAEKPAHEKMRLKAGGRGEFEFNTLVHDQKLTIATYAGYRKLKKVSRGDGDIVNALWQIADTAEQQTPLQTPFPLDLQRHDPLLAGYKIIVTAGTTAEKVSVYGDVITRHGAALQGYSVAASLAQMGADVTLITGKTSLVLPYKNIKIIKIESSLEMLAAIQRALPADVFVGCATVTDFTALDPLPRLQKSGEAMKLYLSPVPDILETVGTLPQNLRPRIVIGFAAATEGLLQNAAQKLRSKNIDALCAMPAGRHMSEVSFISAHGPSNWGDISYADAGLKLGTAISLPPFSPQLSNYRTQS